MTDIIAEIEKAIEKAADKHLREVNRNYNEIQQANMPNVLIGEGFDAGCAFILPLLKKTIEDRDNYIRLCEHFERPHEKDSEIRVCNNEIFELLGEKHE